MEELCSEITRHLSGSQSRPVERKTRSPSPIVSRIPVKKSPTVAELIQLEQTIAEEKKSPVSRIPVKKSPTVAELIQLEQAIAEEKKSPVKRSSPKKVYREMKLIQHFIPQPKLQRGASQDATDYITELSWSSSAIHPRRQISDARGKYLAQVLNWINDNLRQITPQTVEQFIRSKWELRGARLELIKHAISEGTKAVLRLGSGNDRVDATVKKVVQAVTKGHATREGQSYLAAVIEYLGAELDELVPPHTNTLRQSSIDSDPELTIVQQRAQTWAKQQKRAVREAAVGVLGGTGMFNPSLTEIAEPELMRSIVGFL